MPASLGTNLIQENQPVSSRLPEFDLTNKSVPSTVINGLV